MQRAIAAIALAAVFAPDHRAAHVDPRVASSCRLALLSVLPGTIRYDDDPPR